MLEKRVYLYTIFGLISKGLVNVFAFFAGILLIRLLSKEDYGKYSYVSSVATIFGVIINFGLTNYYVREMSRDAERAWEHLETFLGIQTILAFVVFAILAVIAAFHTDPDHAYGILYFGLGMCVTSLVGPFMGFLTSCLRGDLVYRQMLLQAILHLLLTLLGFLVRLPLVYYMLIPLITGAIRMLHSVIDTGHLGRFAWPKFHFGTWKAVFVDSLPFGLLTGINIIYMKLDIILFTHLQSNEATAVYSVSTRLAYILVLVPAIFTENLFPVFSRKKEEENGLYQKLLERFTFYNWALYLPIAVGGCIEGMEIIRLLFGERYLVVYAPYCIYLFLPLWVALYLPVNHYILAFGKTWQLVKVAISSLVINVIANFILLSYLQGTKAMVASALVTLITEANFCFWTFFILRQIGEFHFPVRQFLRTLLPLSLMILVLIVIPTSNIMIRIPAGAAVYGIGIWIFGILAAEDKQRILRILKLS